MYMYRDSGKREEAAVSRIAMCVMAHTWGKHLPCDLPMINMKHGPSAASLSNQGGESALVMLKNRRMEGVPCKQTLHYLYCVAAATSYYI